MNVCQGGDEIVIEGSNFGVTGAASSVLAWSIPASIPSSYSGLASSLVFPAVNCSVIQDHVLIHCLTSGGVGGSLSWRVSVEGLESTVPVSSYGAPVISAVTIASTSIP